MVCGGAAGGSVFAFSLTIGWSRVRASLLRIAAYRCVSWLLLLFAMTVQSAVGTVVRAAGHWGLFFNILVDRCIFALASHSRLPLSVRMAQPPLDYDDGP